MEKARPLPKKSFPTAMEELRVEEDPGKGREEEKEELMAKSGGVGIGGGGRAREEGEMGDSEWERKGKRRRVEESEEKRWNLALELKVRKVELEAEVKVLEAIAKRVSEAEDLERLLELEKTFHCPLCQQLMLLPLTLPCKHAYCGICLHRVASDDNTVECLVCGRKEIDLETGLSSTDLDAICSTTFPLTYHKRVSRFLRLLQRIETILYQTVKNETVLYLLDSQHLIRREIQNLKGCEKDDIDLELTSIDYTPVFHRFIIGSFWAASNFESLPHSDGDSLLDCPSPSPSSSTSVCSSDPLSFSSITTSSAPRPGQDAAQNSSSSSNSSATPAEQYRLSSTPSPASPPFTLEQRGISPRMKGFRVFEQLLVVDAANPNLSTDMKAFLVLMDKMEQDINGLNGESRKASISRLLHKAFEFSGAPRPQPSSTSTGSRSTTSSIGSDSLAASKKFLFDKMLDAFFELNESEKQLVSRWCRG